MLLLSGSTLGIPPLSAATSGGRPRPSGHKSETVACDLHLNNSGGA